MYVPTIMPGFCKLNDLYMSKLNNIFKKETTQYTAKRCLTIVNKNNLQHKYVNIENKHYIELDFIF